MKLPAQLLCEPIQIAAPRPSPTRCVFLYIFPSALGGVPPCLRLIRCPAVAKPPADISSDAPPPLFRLTDGQVSLLVAPVSACLCAIRILTFTFHLLHPGYGQGNSTRRIDHAPSARSATTRTEMVEMAPGQFAVVAALSTFLAGVAPPRAHRTPGDTVEFRPRIRSPDPALRRPVVRTTLLPLTEWSSLPIVFRQNGDTPWEGSSFFGPQASWHILLF